MLLLSSHSLHCLGRCNTSSVINYCTLSNCSCLFDKTALSHQDSELMCPAGHQLKLIQENKLMAIKGVHREKSMSKELFP